jgi:general L-amino acid transport system ATP-binding protein
VPNIDSSSIAPVLQIRHLSKSFGGTQVLRDVSLSVKRGERVVIIGPSGAGKSMLIRCVNGLEARASGQIVVAGVALRPNLSNVQAVRREVGMVFQHFNLFSHLTVLENLTLAPRVVKGLRRAEAESLAYEYLERVRIPEHAHKYPVQLSGGQQQRVAIARALCMQPSIMLFDEPTSALDPEMVREVLDVMTELARGGMTMICVTHEMSFARTVADTLVFMDRGDMVEAGNPTMMFNRPRSARTAAFLSSILPR